MIDYSYYIKTIIIFFLIFSHSNVAANALTTTHLFLGTAPFLQQYLTDKLVIFTSFGTLKVRAQEYAFYHDVQISRLIWNTYSIPLLKAGFSYHFTPHFSFSGAFWTTPSKKNSHLFDYDWAYLENPYHQTNMSSHSNTKLKASGFDINLRYWITKFNSPTRFAWIFGIQNNNFRWLAPFYGYFEYEQPIILHGFYGTKNQPGIFYQQTYKVPYIGFSLGATQRKWTFDSEYKISQFGTIRTLDIHHLRKMLFRERPRTKPLVCQCKLYYRLPVS